VDPSPPRLLGRYALYDRIAAGGMATVHLGRLLGPVGFSRTVAIKRLQPQFAEDPEFVSMFLDEARLAARIRHPNVVPTLDVVSTQGELFLVMEYVQGDSLARLIRTSHNRGESASPAMMATLMVGVLNGLHAAHEAKNEQGEPLGLVHRDVSPHNILVGIDGVARLLDFGVAKAIGRLQTTRDGQLKGKLAYMAPEQVRGTVSRATDIYAASVVLWEGLVGRRAFSGDSEAEIFGQVLQGRVEAPSRHAANIPAALDAAIIRGMDPDPARRFPTAREMARAVADAVHLVDSSVIGEWVESLAKQTLDTRSDLVASIESDSVRRAPSAGWSETSDGARAPHDTDAFSSAVMPEIPVVQEDIIPTQLSSGSVSARDSASAIAQSTPRTPWKGIATAGGLAVCLLVLLLLVSSWGHGEAASSSGAIGASSANGVAAASPVTSPSPAPAPASSDSLALPLLAPSAASSVPSASSAPRAASPGHRPSVAAPASPRRGTNCNPPYYFEGGVRVFKTECL
jgi:serine/threonine protein kinase